jgi:hypothetical protein
METLPLHSEQWDYVRTLLPVDLEQSAKSLNALVRCRNVPDAEALMRMALAYALSDLSLKDVAAWATAMNLAEITGPSLFYRLREAEAWLAHVLAQTLAAQACASPMKWPIRVVDATVINGPGPVAVQWRAHVLVEPATGGFRAVELTGSEGGEKLARHAVRAGEVILGDRAYATARGVHAVRQAEAHVLVRLNPVTLRMCDENKERIHLEKREGEVPKVGGIEFNILIPVPPKPTKSHRIWKSIKAIAWISARVIAGRTRDGEVIWVLTTVPQEQLSTTSALELYRFRWQIELLFKRLKSLLHLDTLPSRQGPTAKSWMLARLLAAALAQQLVQPSGPLSPWGYELRPQELHA